MTLKTTTSSDCPQELIELFTEANTKLESHLKLNYALDKLVDNQIVCYSVTTLDDVPISGSVAYARDFYNGAVRVATKYYVSPRMQNSGLLPDKFYKNGIRTYLADQIDQQIDYCKNLGYNNFFVSRDHPSFRITKRLYNGIEQTCKHKGWTLYEDQKLVAPNPGDPHCWQHVIWLGRYTLNDV
jgi:hypothetical protein